MKDILQGNGTSLLHKRLLNICSTNTSQIVFTSPILLAALSCSTRTPPTPYVRISSVYIHDTKKKGNSKLQRKDESSWVLLAVVSRAAFRRVPPYGKPHFTVMSLHINNHYAKRRAIEKNVLFANRTVMCQEQIDMVAGDFKQRCVAKEKC